MFQECYSGVFMKYSGVLRIFLKSVVEPNFRKCSGLHVNNSDRVLLLVKLQGFTENDSERVNDAVSSFMLWWVCF